LEQPGGFINSERQTAVIINALDAVCRLYDGGYGNLKLCDVALHSPYR
jgi:hypothetical protein